MTDAPPLGQRPTEPRPGKESLHDPRGEAKAEAGNARGANLDGAAGGPETCPDCGLPFGEHPDYHLHDGGQGAARWAEADLGNSRGADDLPGRRLDQELGGDPAEE